MGQWGQGPLQIRAPWMPGFPLAGGQKSSLQGVLLGAWPGTQVGIASASKSNGGGRGMGGTDQGPHGKGGSGAGTGLLPGDPGLGWEHWGLASMAVAWC